MVSEDRGQLILVGAIAIALVVLGLVLIVNTALFTQVVGSEGTVESAKEGGVTGQEVGHAIGAVIAEENRDDSGDDIDDIVDNSLEPALLNRSLEESGSFVSLAYLGENESGTLIEQESPDLLTDEDPDDDWSPVTSGDVGRFLLNIDTIDSDGGDFEVTANSTSTASSRTLEVSVDSSTVTLSGAGAHGCTDVQAPEGTIRLDLRHGGVYESSDCQFDLFGDGPAPYNVSFDGGDDIHATYSIATDQTGFSDSGHPEYPSGGGDIIWSFEYAFTYGSPDVMAESESRVIDVYD